MISAFLAFNNLIYTIQERWILGILLFKIIIYIIKVSLSIFYIMAINFFILINFILLIMDKTFAAIYPLQLISLSINHIFVSEK